jgi:hypothetical protein
MLAALLTLAAETSEEESSQALFYILGGAAAVWAIVLFALGMRAPSFPASQGAQRAVIAVSVLVVVAAMASSVLAS